jgi:hypothetical protein
MYENGRAQKDCKNCKFAAKRKILHFKGKK